MCVWEILQRLIILTQVAVGADSPIVVDSPAAADSAAVQLQWQTWFEKMRCLFLLHGPSWIVFLLGYLLRESVASQGRN